MGKDIDLIKYEVFVRSLTTILEEGRQAIAMVSGSPAIAEGGEFMTSFYDGDGKGVLTAAGTLFHVMGTGDAIKDTIKEYSENPGIFEGDQFFYNDAYMAGTHIMDQIIIKPMFHKDRRIAWVGTMTHTGDVGGILRGLSMEIFHEGLRIRGVKIVEGGIIRKDILRSITDQCRDPEYVNLDQLARIASNNVCTEGLNRLIERFGIEFVEAAFRKLQGESERLFRQKLRNLPDGTWRSRVYGSRTHSVHGREETIPLKEVCKMTKEGDQLTFDLTGTSPQVEDYANAALPCTRSCLFTALASSLIWDIPWNSDMMNYVNYTIPEGTFVNCRFPASCGLGTLVGFTLIGAAASCIAKMLYAAGLQEFVNSSWGAIGLAAGSFGPGTWWGGHNQHGGVVGSGTYDLFAGGLGATPSRDGVDTGAVYVNPSSSISDVEWVEMYFPFLFLARRHVVDSGGYGRFRGGLALQTIQLVYGTKDLTTDYLPGPEGGEIRGFGLFGGYPVGNYIQDSYLFIADKEKMLEQLSEERKYPTVPEELNVSGVNISEHEDFNLERELGGIRIQVPEHSVIVYTYGCGGGYGDPLDRDPERVLEDVKKAAATIETATNVYGVIIEPSTLEIDLDKTEKKRNEIRKERIEKSQKLTDNEIGTRSSASPSGEKKSLMRIHEYLEIIEDDSGRKVISCIKCGNHFCETGDNYKNYSLRWTKDIREMKPVEEGKQSITHYQEYICPGCGTLLEVDPWCPQIDDEAPVWDIDVKI